MRLQLSAPSFQMVSIALWCGALGLLTVSPWWAWGAFAFFALFMERWSILVFTATYAAMPSPKVPGLMLFHLRQPGDVQSEPIALPRGALPLLAKSAWHDIWHRDPVRPFCRILIALGVGWSMNWAFSTTPGWFPSTGESAFALMFWYALQVWALIWLLSQAVEAYALPSSWTRLSHVAVRTTSERRLVYALALTLCGVFVFLFPPLILLLGHAWGGVWGAYHVHTTSEEASAPPVIS